MIQSFPKPTKEIKKRKSIRKIGRRGKKSILANKELVKLFTDKEIYFCELRFAGCMVGNMLSFAHRHKRREYIGREEMLSNFNQVILGCIPCHMKIEKDAQLTERIFLVLRGEDEL